MATNADNALSPEDYVEPACVLSMHHGDSCGCGEDHSSCGCGKHGAHSHGKSIPMEDIIAESDRLFNANDSVQLGEHLRHWRTTAQEYGDQRGELSILNELLGHYRMTAQKERGLAAVDDALALMTQLDTAGTVSGGTILLNAATTLQSFGVFDRALRLYDEAFRCYNVHLDPTDWRFAGLYNNMAAAYLETGDFVQAEAHYRRALAVLQACDNKMDTAVTCVNLAQLYDAQNPEDERIDDCLTAAMACFNDPHVPRDGYYAHTCMKCASAFGHFGWFLDEQDLRQRAEDFYARS